MSDAAAEVGIVLAMLFLMFASAITGYAVGRQTDHGGENAAVATTQTAEETVTTSGGAGGEGATETEGETTSAGTTTGQETTGGGAGGGGGGASAADGKQVFASAGCGSCHTLDAAGSSGTIGPNLDDSKPSVATAVERVRNGKSPMPAYKDQLTEAQIQAVAKFVSDSSGG